MNERAEWMRLLEEARRDYLQSCVRHDWQRVDELRLTAEQMEQFARNRGWRLPA